MEERPLKLGEMLLKAGLIDEFQLESALSLHRNVGGKTGRALIKLGYIREETILEFLSKQTHFSRVDLKKISVTRAVLSMIPFAKMHKCLIFPFDVRRESAGRTLLVAMTDPTDLNLIDELQFIAGCRVRPFVASEAEIRSALNRYDPEAKMVVSSEPDYDFQDISHQLGSTSAEEGAGRLDRLIGLLEKKGILNRNEVEQLLSPVESHEE